MAKESWKHIAVFEKVYRNTSFYRKVHNLGRDKDEKSHNENKKQSVLEECYGDYFRDNIFELLSVEGYERILNVGSGYGVDERALSSLYPHVELHGVDASISMLETAVKVSPCARYALCMAEALPYRERSIDKVVSREVLEHVVDPYKMMQEIYRVLRCGAIAVITTPNGSALSVNNLMEKLWKKKGGLKDEHLTIGEARSLFKEAGFEVEQVRYDGILYFHIGMIPAELSFMINSLQKLVSYCDGIPVVNQLMADQVKYKLRKSCECNELENRADYICVRCNGKLEPANSEFLCTKCGRIYDGSKGFANFIYMRDEMEEVYKELLCVSQKEVYQKRSGYFRVAKWLIWSGLSIFYTVLLMIMLPIGLVVRASRTLTNMLMGVHDASKL
jgi:SAM-dependent methyltransferase